MAILSNPEVKSILSSPLIRLLASVVSWFMYLCSFTLLVLCFVSVLAVGGRCASGNSAYVIAVHCPAGATIFLPWVIFTALIAVAIGAAGTNGFGVPVVAWAWPILFCVLGLGFLLVGQVVGIALGIMFEVMGLVPLIIDLRAGVARTFIGSANVMGQRFIERDGAKPGLTLRGAPNPDGAVPLRFGDWLLATVLFLVSAGGGIYVALAWYSNVAS